MSTDKQIFETECHDLLHEMESALLDLENNPEHSDQVNSVFRAAHTIKGSAGLFGFQVVIDYTHRLESVLDRIRTRELTLSEDLLSIFLKSRDVMEELVRSAIYETPPSETCVLLEKETTAVLVSYLDQEPETPPEEAADSGQNGPALWRVSAQFGEDAFRNGTDPASFFSYLSSLGEVENLNLDWGALPREVNYDPESCYLSVELEILTSENQQAIEDVFMFAMDDCTLSVSLVEPEAEAVPVLSVIKGSAGGEPNGSAPNGSAPNGSAPEVKSSDAEETIRVSASKLESLINLVGELVIASAKTQLLSAKTEDAELIESTVSMARLVEDIRDNGLGLRMVPIGETFNRFRRVVRDLSAKLKKDIGLEITGADKELDKSVVEKIRDPLMHLIRNAMDHGIESVEERIANGKPEKARIHLHAYHDSGCIVIEVEDDGAGLSKEKILAKAQSHGLVREGQELSDREVFQLIFNPGFSTAESVTDISGRGVGLDVVSRNIAELRGEIDVQSTPGVGSIFRIKLPLTLAIISGFLVKVGRYSYVIPLDSVQESIEYHPVEGTGPKYLRLREEILPYIKLNELFNEPDISEERKSVVVVKSANQKVGFVVDELLGEYQTVIKPLGKLFQHLSGVSGATILGSGEVATIIDVPALIKRVVAQSKSSEGKVSEEVDETEFRKQTQSGPVSAEASAGASGSNVTRLPTR